MKVAKIPELCKRTENIVKCRVSYVSFIIGALETVPKRLAKRLKILNSVKELRLSK